MYYIALIVFVLPIIIWVNTKLPKLALLLCAVTLFLPLYHINTNSHYKNNDLVDNNFLKVSSFNYSSPWLVLQSNGIVSGFDVKMLGNFATAIKHTMRFLHNQDSVENADILIGGLYEEDIKNLPNFALGDSYGSETMVVLGPYHFYGNDNTTTKEDIVKLAQNKKIGTLYGKRFQVVLGQIGLTNKSDIRYYSTLNLLLEDYINNKVDLLLVSKCSLKDISSNGLESISVVYSHLPNKLYVAFNKNSDSFEENIGYFNKMIDHKGTFATCS